VGTLVVHVNRYQYLALMLGCLLLTLPLEFIFVARVWRRPRRLAIALAPACLVFVGWDLWSSATATWDFNRAYTVGLRLPGGMAVEELLFFVTIPVCALLTLESVRNILDGRVSPLGRRRAHR
jgi:lycopene cyclase domain-containing protein